LSKGVADGIFVSIEAYRGFKFYEVIKYVTDCREIGFGVFQYIFINKESWNKLQPEDQEALAAVALEYMELRDEMMDGDEMGAKELFLSQPGREWITLSSAEMEQFKEVRQVMIDEYISDMNAMGLPGADYIQYLEERIEYWTAQQP